MLFFIFIVKLVNWFKGAIMREVGTFEAKTKLSELLDAVAAGEKIMITRHGKQAARLVPPQNVYDRARAHESARQIKEMRKGVKLGRMTIKELINAGRR